MENPWDDPWGDTSHKNPPEQGKPVPSWDQPVAVEQEIAPEPPSWQPKETVQWTAPAPTSNPSWNGGEHPSWSSPHSPSVKTTTTPLRLDEDPVPPFTKVNNDDVPSVSPPPTSVAPVNDNLPSPVVIPADIPHTFLRAVSPVPGEQQEDAFGGFESGLDSATDEVRGGWSTSPNRFLERSASSEDVWGSSWGPSATQETEDEQPDEWEAALKRKEDQDKHIPPGLLQNIIGQFEQLGIDLWKEENSAESSSDGSIYRHFDSQLLNLNSCQDKIVPEQLSLPFPVPFSQSFASKQLVDSLKLTRHCLVSQMGPLAMYVASKGSTSWEASVKAKAENSDVAPPGWKIVSREDSPNPEQAQKRLPINGGILSFFTRRSTNPPNSEGSQRPPSPAASTAGSIKTEGNSQRPSVDSPIAPSPQTKELVPSSTAPTKPLYQSPVPQSLSLPPTISKGPDVFSNDDHAEEAPAPSTMSRLFGRFTRNSRIAISQKDSISLSADDIEFLSDVIPVTQEEVKEDAQLRALSSMIGSFPPPAALPPLLAPPPRVPKPVPRMSGPSPSLRDQAVPAINHDLFNMFETPALPDKAVANPSKQLQPLPSIPSSDSAHDLSVSASVSSAASSDIFSASTSFSDFFNSPPSSNTRTFSVPPPIPPPKPSEAFRTPTESGQSAAMPIRNALPSQSSSLLPPPPSSRPRIPISQNLSETPSSSSRSHTPVSLISQPSQPTINEEDEFSDFITSPTTKSSHSQKPVVSSFWAPILPTSTATTYNEAQFDDFNDFFGPTTLSHSQPVQAIHSGVSLPQSRPSPPPQIIPTQSSPRVSRAEHQRTLSLLETVASRGDKWLSPPSPLPVALPPPNAVAKTSDLMGSRVSMETQQAQAIAALPTPPGLLAPPVRKLNPSPGWSFPPPPPANGLQPNVSSTSTSAPSGLGAITPRKSLVQPTSSTSTSSTKQGGLSAQDLAFFEGL